MLQVPQQMLHSPSCRQAESLSDGALGIALQVFLLGKRIEESSRAEKDRAGRG